MEKDISLVAVLIGNKVKYKSEEFYFSEKDISKNTLNISNQKLYIEKLGKTSDNENILLITKRDYQDHKYKIPQLKHDIREPLKNISNFLTLIEKSILSGNIKQTKEYISFAIDAVKILNNFSKGILNEQTEKQAVDLKDIISDIKSLDKALFEKYNLKILFDNNIPKLEGNYSDLISLFKNLIENSIKHSNNEKIIIIIKVKLIQSDSIIMSFSDNNILSNKNSANIELILQENINLKNSSGLIICKNIIEKQGGKLKLNRENKTCSYDITLPLWRNYENV